MTPQEFIAKWQPANLSERGACQEHFLDLCEVLGRPKPAAADPEGAWYAFERGVHKSEGGSGWADVWLKDHFGWEYKRKKKDLNAAYQQLLLYRESLDNPPLLVVCDLNRFEVHTNFTRTTKKVYAFDLSSLAEPSNLDVLRHLFTDPDALRPGLTTENITQHAAEQFSVLADGMRDRGIEPHAAAHFLMKLMFCMFAEDIGLLPVKMFSDLLKAGANDQEYLTDRLSALFQAMSTGGYFGTHRILHFNGGLFSDSAVIDLLPKEITTLVLVNEFEWSDVEPSIFGTLFERTLDPAKRSQIGAHYTSQQDILMIVEPVMMVPLRREWEAVRAKCEKLTDAIAKAKTAQTKRNKIKQREKALRDFVERLAEVKVLDPACGSGNFLYVAINQLLDLEKEVISYAATRQLGLLPQVRPTQLAGIEINPYAQELAQVVIWIGFLQWMHHNGFQPPSNPVLEQFESIVNKDAILDLSDPDNPKEPDWPDADFIIGNPPFLGTKKLRGELGDSYVDALFQMYRNRVPNFVDLCCYWFEKSRALIKRGKCRRAGLLATQGIRGGLNREVLKRIKEHGGIFFAVSDHDWVLDGAVVHVSMIGFDDGTEEMRVLDGIAVESIHSNLTSSADITTAKQIRENSSIGFIGDVKSGKFDLPFSDAWQMLACPNPNHMPNSDVLRPWSNGRDVVQRPSDTWIIDFGDEMPLNEAAMYESPLLRVEVMVKPLRDKVKRKRYREWWWLHAEPCAEMRRRIEPLDRFLVTTTVSKHRLFAWMSPTILPDHQLVVFATDEDWFFGILHSRVHEIWALSQGTQVRERESGFRYTPTSCFETFPFPEPTDVQRDVIAEAARELDGLRNNWLNPPEWTREEVLEFPGTVDGPWSRYVVEPDERGIGTVRYPRTVAKDDACAKKLKKRTLTNLYNERPTWLDIAHRKLDEAVFDAYGWDSSISDDELLAKLLALNIERSGKS